MLIWLSVVGFSVAFLNKNLKFSKIMIMIKFMQ